MYIDQNTLFQAVFFVDIAMQRKPKQVGFLASFFNLFLFGTRNTLNRTRP